MWAPMANSIVVSRQTISCPEATWDSENGGGVGVCEEAGRPGDRYRVSLAPAARAKYDRDLATIHAGVGKAACAAEKAGGKALTVEQALTDGR